MASPGIEAFLVLTSSDVPLTGGAGGMSFAYYGDDQGTPITPPTIVEIGGGVYKFTPTFPVDPNRAVAYAMATGTGNLPAYYWGFLRPERHALDIMPTIVELELGQAKIFDSGGDANNLVIYAPDNTTPVAKFLLHDLDGAVTNQEPSERDVSSI